MPADTFSIHAVFPNYYDDTRVSYSFRSLAQGMARPGLTVNAYVLGTGPGKHPEVNPLLPRRLYRYSSRLVREPCRAIVARYGHRMERGDVAHLWLDSPVDLVRRLQARGILVVREMINCTLSRYRQELTAAHAALERPYAPTITEAGIERERVQLLAVDAVFCPNDGVLESVLASGVPAARCIKTSYGWSVERLTGSEAHVPADGGVRFLFVGSGDVRKGLPFLLAAWERAGVAGQLLIAGRIDPQVRIDCARSLARSDVIELGHVARIGDVYRSADVFCFTSWEEGGPMVTIEAMGMGLPCIVSPMGSAGVLSERSGGGVVVAPDNIDGIAAALRQLADDAGLRRRLGAEAYAIAQNYLWHHVGRRRTDALIALRESSARTGDREHAPA